MTVAARRRAAEMTVRERIILEEFKIWKKNSPFLYDLVVSRSVDRPTSTLQWLPGVDSSRSQHYNIHSLLFGTTTAGKETSYVEFAEVVLPTDSVESRPYDDEKAEVGCGDVTATKKIVHEGDVNRARYMPQSPGIIATKTVRGTVLVFDTAKHPSEPADAVCRPNTRLTGHSKAGSVLLSPCLVTISIVASDSQSVGMEAKNMMALKTYLNPLSTFRYGLAWNPHTCGVLIDASDDKTICQWSLSAATSSFCEAERWYRGHSGPVEDVCWHSGDGNVFVSVGQEGDMMVWDTRSESAAQTAKVHTGKATSVAFNPVSTDLLATGGADATVGIWDLRNLGKRLHSFACHSAGVVQVSWSAKMGTILASASDDRRVNVWDMARVGRPQEPEEPEDGPPELLFVHGGHTAAVVELSWSPVEDWILASTAEDRVIQIWEMAKNVHHQQHNPDGDHEGTSEHA